MKKIIKICMLVAGILLSATNSILQAQNLVLNPRFEEINFCPYGLDQIEACKYWLNFGNSPDYYNACAHWGINVPYSEFGFEYAHAGGDAYAGISTYEIPTDPSGPNYREFIGIKLTHELQIRIKYYISFFVNCAGGPSVGVAANKIGCRFSTKAYDSCCPPPINNWAQVYTDSIFADSAKWHLIMGSLYVDSTYSYLGIGNFFDDSHTDTIHIKGKPFPRYTYYYIDDVCVTSDSLYNEEWTGIAQLKHNRNQIIIYPNPANKSINIVCSKEITSYSICNLFGETIFSSETLSIKPGESIKICCSEYPDGVYLIRVLGENFMITKKVLINH